MEKLLLRAEERTLARALTDDRPDKPDKNYDRYEVSGVQSAAVRPNAKAPSDGYLSCDRASAGVFDKGPPSDTRLGCEWTNDDGLSDHPHLITPAGGVFRRVEFEANAGRFWSCPVALSKEGVLKRLLGPTGSRRSRGLAASVLPVVALMTWPGKGNAGDMVAFDSEWTPPVQVSARYAARLAGIDKDSVRPAIAQLEHLGLARARLVLPDNGGSERPRLAVQLSATLFHVPGDPEERFVKFPAELIYGGAWSLISTPAIRHLFLVLMCEQRILDVEGFAAALIRDGYESGRIQTEITASRRKNALPIRQLSRRSGLSPSTVQVGISALTKPLPGSMVDAVLINTGGNWLGPSKWFAPNLRPILSEPFVAMNDDVVPGFIPTDKWDTPYQETGRAVPQDGTLIELYEHEEIF